jgi:ATP-dependent helicase/nuclease subunit B
MLNIIFKNLSEKTTGLVTPNQRLSLNLKKQYDTAQQKMGKSTWETAKILPLNAWLDNLWREVPHKNSVLLSAEQENLLWQKIISSSKVAQEQLLNLNSLAENAQQSFALMQKWQIPLSWPTTYNNEDSKAFQGWVEEFLKQTEQQKIFAASTLPDQLATLISQQPIILPYTEIIFVGFEQITPQINKLLNILKEQNYKINSFDPNSKNNTQKRRLSFPNEKKEIFTMINWAKARYLENPDCSIGCVVPNLPSLKNTVSAICNEIFADDKIFNISLGEPLTNLPLVSTALHLLAINQTALDLNTWQDLLLSPFWGEVAAEDDLSERATLLHKLKKLKKPQLKLATIINYASKNLLLIKRLSKQKENFADLKNKLQTPSQWAKFFTEQLTLLGWPGPRLLNSSEYQLWQRWQELLSILAQDDLVSNPLTYTNALSRLKKLAAKSLFQPESTNPENINILGVLEAAGLNFDYLWIMGLDHEHWPTQPKPNPFLPLNLQKKYALPHSSYEEELKLCRALTARWSKSADVIIYSHAQQNEDQQLKISPLLQDIPQGELKDLDLNLEPSRFEKIYQSKQLETFIDNSAPPVITEEKISGGSKILKLQAQCPFRAFAECRLQLAETTEPQPGFNKMDRGNLLHAALEMIWKSLGKQQKLIDLKPQELENIIISGINYAMAKIIKNKNFGFEDEKIIALERICLKNILERWLTQEKMRSPFSIISIEEKNLVQVGKLTLQIRLDRIDKLEDGSLIIIDYKTGKHGARLQDWFGERPEDPQLPLYCVTASTAVKGLVFAKVHVDALGFIGIHHDKTFPGVSSLEDLVEKNLLEVASWSELLKMWRKTLEQLAEDFCLGKAEVDPKNGELTCQHCHLAMLCRKVYQI